MLSRIVAPHRREPAPPPTVEWSLRRIPHCRRAGLRGDSRGRSAMGAPDRTPATNPHLLATTGAPSDSDRLLRAMTAVLARQQPSSAAEALRLLRHGYPEIPLAMRIAALNAVRK